MRKETRDVMTAFIEGKACTRARTRTDGRTVWLHGNVIAWREPGFIFMTPAGWATRTTFDRLNGLRDLLGVPHRYHTKRHRAMLGDAELYSSKECANVAWHEAPRAFTSADMLGVAA